MENTKRYVRGWIPLTGYREMETENELVQVSRLKKLVNKVIKPFSKASKKSKDNVFVEDEIPLSCN